jgi:hypothetical protein
MQVSNPLDHAFAALQNREATNNAEATHLCCDNVKQIGV